ncbi:MAG: methyl-accepting chemotaxis protein [Beijerinckiaceae bacterium]
MRFLPKFLNRLAVKLPAFAIISAIICAASVGFIAYRSAEAELKAQKGEMLETIANFRAGVLKRVGEDLATDLAIVIDTPIVLQALSRLESSFPSLASAVKELQDHYIDKSPLPVGKRAGYDGASDNSDYGLFHKNLHPAIRRLAADKGYYDLFFINMKGDVVYTVEKELDFGSNLRTGPWKTSGLAKAFEGALKASKDGLKGYNGRPPVHFEDYEAYAPSNNEPAAFMASAINDGKGNALGVVAIQLPSKVVANAIAQTFGKTAVAYAYAPDKTLRTLIGRDSTREILSVLPASDILERGSSGKRGFSEALGSNGKPALIGVGPSEFLGKNWTVAVEVDMSEINDPIRQMGLQILMVTGLLLLLISAVNYVFARSVFKPILAMRDAVARIANGENVEIPGENRSDELGELARALHQVHDAGVASARIKSALDNAGTNVMIADAENHLIYTNQALLRFFSDHSAEFRRQYPNFSAEQMIGTAMDTFRDGSGRLQVVNGEALRKQIRIDNLTVELAMNAVLDTSGARIGTIIEWNDLTADVNAMGEVGQVVEAANRGDFTARIREDNKTGLVRHLAGGINGISNLVEKAMDDFSGALGLIAQGDLTNRVTTEYEGIFDRVSTGINDTIERLAETVATIQQTTRDISAAAREINAGATDLAKRTEDEAASLEETAATTEELAASVKQTADSSRTATELSAKARAVAAEGGAIVTDAVDAIERIERASRQISEIIGVIDDIAFQTNLLALNAAVEAARAGDAGKGFAVVASEVRTLAQRSSQAAKDIKGLITSSEAQVAEGARLVRATGQSLNNIVSASSQVAETVTVISSATAEQANGIEEMSQTVARIDEMTQQNSALAEQSAASATELINQIERLNTLVATFRVDQQTSTPSARGSNTSEPERLRQLAAMAFAQSRTVPAGQTGAKAGAVRAAPVQRAAAAGRASRDDWAEF